MNNPLGKEVLAMPCTIVAKTCSPRCRTGSGQGKEGAIRGKSKARGASFPPKTAGSESTGAGLYPQVGRCTEKKGSGGPAVAVNKCAQAGWPWKRPLQAESPKVARELLPEWAPDPAQVIPAPQYCMSTSKASQDNSPPGGHQPGGHATIRRYANRGIPKTLPALLLPCQRQQQRPDHRTHRVLEIGNQLDRKQRKGPPPFSTEEPGNGNRLLLKLRKKLDRISPVRRDLSVAIRLPTERTARPKVGEKINSIGQKGFLVFPNRMESVKVWALDFLSALLTRGRSLGCETVRLVSS